MVNKDFRIKIKRGALVFFISLLFNSLNAQSYLKVHGSSNLGMGSQYLQELWNEDGRDDKYVASQKFLSLGKGFSPGVTYGYSFSRFIAAEVDFNYLFGATTTAKFHFSNAVVTTSFHAQVLQINPALLIFAPLERSDLKPYGRFGLNLGILPTITREFIVEGSIAEETRVSKLTGGMPLGFSTSVGLLWDIGKFEIFAEIQMINMSYSPNKLEVVELNQFGQDVLNAMDPNEREINFVDEIDSNTPYDPNGPGQEIRSDYAFGSIGLKIGLLVDL